MYIAAMCVHDECCKNRITIDDTNRTTTLVKSRYVLVGLWTPLVDVVSAPVHQLLSSVPELIVRSQSHLLLPIQLHTHRGKARGR